MILSSLHYSLLCEDEKQAVAVKSQLQLISRPMYSNPPLHGALVVSTVLGDPELKKQWLTEVKVKRYYIEPPTSLNHFFFPQELYAKNTISNAAVVVCHFCKVVGRIYHMHTVSH